MKANFMKKTCAWVMTTVTVATAIVPNTVNVAFAADVEPDTNTSMQIDDADVSANTSVAPVELLHLLKMLVHLQMKMQTKMQMFRVKKLLVKMLL